MTTSLCRLRGPLLAGLLVASAGGCASLHWTVVQQAVPNPLVGKTQFTLEAISFAPVTRQLNELQQDAERTRALLAQTFSQALTDHAWKGGVRVATTAATATASATSAPAPAATMEAFILRPKVVLLEAGFSTRSGGVVGSSLPAEVRVQVEIVDATGKIVDVIRVEAADTTSGTAPTPERLAECSRALGTDLARYLMSRVFQ